MKKIFLLFFILLFTPKIIVQGQSSLCILKYRIDVKSEFFNFDYQINICKDVPVKIFAEQIPNASYQWFKDSVLIKDANTYFFELTEKGNYTVEAKTLTCAYKSPQITINHVNTLGEYSLKIADYPVEILDEYSACSGSQVFSIGLNYVLQKNLKYYIQKNGEEIELDYYGFNVAQNGIYSFRVTQGSCQLNTAPFKVTNANILTDRLSFKDFGDVPDTLYLCQGTSIQVQPKFLALTYNWFKDGKPVVFNGSWYNRQFTISESGVYHVEDKPSYCNFISKPLHVIVGNKLQQPKLMPVNHLEGCGLKTLTVDETTYRFLGALAAPNIKTSWLKDDMPILGTSGTFLKINDISGNYKLRLSTDNCVVDSKAFSYNYSLKEASVLKLIVNNKINQKKFEVCPKEGIFAKINNSDNPNFQIRWFKNNLPIQDKTKPDLEILETGSYYAILEEKGSFCKIFTDTISVTVKNEFPTKIIESPTNCISSLAVPLTAGVNYSWKRDGKVIKGENLSTLYPSQNGTYSVITSRENCYYESQKIKVDNIKKSLISADIFLCEMEDLKLASNASEKYEWSGPNNFSSNLQNPTINKVTFKNNGIYTLLTTNNGCTQRDSVFVTVKQLPNFTIEGNNNICEGANLSILVTPKQQNTYFVWRTPQGETLQNTIFFGITAASSSRSGNYTIEAFGNSCSYKVDYPVTVSRSGNCRSINLKSPNKKLCFNAENLIYFQLNGAFDDDEAFDLFYLNRQGEKSFLTTSKTSPFKLNSNAFGNGLLIVQARKSKLLSNNIEIEVVSMSPTFTYDIATVCTGSVALRIDSINNTYEKIQWLRDGIIIPNANTYQYLATKSGEYSLKISKEGCEARSIVYESSKISVGKLSPFIIRSDVVPYVCEGQTVLLYYDGSQLSNAKYQWYLNGKAIENANDKTFSAKETGTYQLKLIQGNCEAFSQLQKVYIGELKAPEIYSYGYGINTFTSIKKNVGIPIYLGTNDYSKGFGTNDALETFKYSWQKNGVDIDNTSSKGLKVDEDGLYRLKVSQGNCVAFSKEIKVENTQTGKLKISTSSRKECKGEKISIGLFDTGFFISDLSEYSSVEIKVFKNNKYLQNISFKQNIITEESATFHAVASFIYPGDEKRYYVYSDTVSVEIGGNEIIYQPNINKNITTCLDSLFVAFGTGTNNHLYTHQWRLNGVPIKNENSNSIVIKESGSYLLETKNENGCRYISEPFNVTFGKLDISINNYNPWVCSNQENFLVLRSESIISYYEKNNVLNTKPISYEWFFENKSIGTGTSVETAKSGIYTLSSKQGNCTNTVSKKVELIEIAQNISPLKDTLFICTNETISLTAPKADKYTWLKNNSTINENVTQSLQTNKAGIYKVWLELNGCSRISTPKFVIEKNNPAKATISGNQQISYGDSAKIKIDFTSLPPWTFQLSNNQSFTTNKNPFELIVKPSQTSTYQLTSLKNICGQGIVEGSAEIRVLILGNELSEDIKLSIYPIPTYNKCSLEIESALPQIIQYQLFTETGRLIVASTEKMALKNYQNNIDLSPHSSGVYILKIQVGDKIMLRKIIKQ